VDVEKEVQRLYRYAVHVIYAAVIAISFDIARDVVIPIEIIFGHLVNTLLLGLSYFIIVTSWIGYFMSIITSPHKGKIGRLRFGLDILIIFIFYYMVSLTPDSKSAFIPDVFLFVLPVLYFAYFVWDTLKIHEYKDESSAQKHLDRLDARNITLYYLIMFLLVSVVYVVFLVITNFEAVGQGATVRDSSFIAIAFILTLLYRVAKWRHLTKNTFKTKR
jgi:hypothetical protein